MNRNDLYHSFNAIDDDILERSETAQHTRKKPTWLKWGTIAACLCLVAALAVFRTLPYTAEGGGDGCGLPSITVNGIQYLASPRSSHSYELSDGFSCAGTADIDGSGECPYYTNPNIPEWVYVYQRIYSSDVIVDESGNISPASYYNAYVRYVDIRLHSRDLVCYNGEYYISMWSAQYYGDFPDVSAEYYDKVRSTYNIRFEGDVPNGFVSAGVAEFSGYETIPRGSLVSNVGTHEVYINPDEPDVMLVPTYWHTHTKEESKETRHDGYNIYIRYDCPLA